MAEVVAKMLTARRESLARVVREEKRVELAAHRARLAHSRLPCVKEFRREKKRRDKSVAKLIAEAKLELARLDELNKLARRGGRPKKVVNG